MPRQQKSDHYKIIFLLKIVYYNISLVFSTRAPGKWSEIGFVGIIIVGLQSGYIHFIGLEGLDKSTDHGAIQTKETWRDEELIKSVRVRLVMII